MPHEFLTRRSVEFAHDQVLRYGGLAGLLNDDALEAALARPLQRLHDSGQEADIFEPAACYAYGLGTAHAFADANKRTAWASSQGFLALNGVEMLVPSDDAERMMLGLVTGHLTEAEFAGWLRGMAVHFINSRPPA